MFDVNKLEKEELIEYIKKLNDVMDKKDSYIEVLEEKVYMEETLNALDDEIEKSQRSLRAATARMDRFERNHNYKTPIIIDLNEDKETDKVEESKFMVGDIVRCSFLSGEYVVYDRDGSIYKIRNIINDNMYTVKAGALTKVSD